MGGGGGDEEPLRCGEKGTDREVWLAEDFVGQKYRLIGSFDKGVLLRQKIALSGK